MFILNARDIGTPIELCPIMLPQVNRSSEGDIYVDAVGNTYAETLNQTRMTLSNSRTRQVACRISAFVSGGTGTVQLWNATNNSSLGTKTTVSVVEATLDIIQSSLVSNIGDEITLRVKNSNAGESITIVSGGMIAGDQATAITANSTPYGYPCGGYPQLLSFVVIKALSTATYRVQPAAFPRVGNAGETVLFGSSYADDTAGIVQTVRVPYRLQASSGYGLATLAAIGDSIVAMSSNLAGEVS